MYKNKAYNLFIIIVGLTFIILSGCAAPGQKFIDINYYRTLDEAVTQQNRGQKIGVALFKDLRSGMGEGYVGYRVLNDKIRETFMVNGLDLGSSLQKAFLSYYEKNGFEAVPIAAWDVSPQGVRDAPEEFKQIIAGNINEFECRAEKKGVITEMVLDINITVYAGAPGGNILNAIPVSLKLERTEISFTPQKLEHFINLAVEDVMKKIQN